MFLCGLSKLSSAAPLKRRRSVCFLYLPTGLHLSIPVYCSTVFLGMFLSHILCLSVIAYIFALYEYVSDTAVFGLKDQRR